MKLTFLWKKFTLNWFDEKKWQWIFWFPQRHSMYIVLLLEKYFVKPLHIVIFNDKVDFTEFLLRSAQCGNCRNSLSHFFKFLHIVKCKCGKTRNVSLSRKFRENKNWIYVILAQAISRNFLGQKVLSKRCLNLNYFKIATFVKLDLGYTY